MLGQIANTNARDISEALASIGVDVHFHVTVGDNLDRMIETLRRAVGRSDAVVVTGGLGPTPDDITREAVAAVAGVPLRRDPGLEQTVRGIFAELGRPMPEENLRQADLPEGADVISPEGTAPGFAVDVDGCRVYAVPGVPWEMKAMLKKTVLPELAARSGADAILSREVVVFGLGESRTHELISDIVAAQTNPTIAYRAGGGSEARVRLTAKAKDGTAAAELIAPIESAIRERLGPNALDPGASSLPEALGKALSQRELMIAAAESLTGGSIGAALATVPKASSYFRGSLVTYATDAKAKVAHVPQAVLDEHGAVSAECALAMARGAMQVLEADVGISATGVAGPDTQEGKPVGTIFVACVGPDGDEVRQVKGYGDRGNVTLFARNAALDLARRVLTRR